tara:strand:- start:182 stop:610 length:429 start_codon:yes stop_codon:yes gene_type:complete
MSGNFQIISVFLISTVFLYSPYCYANKQYNNIIVCNDTKTNCEELMDLGKCIKNPGFMDRYCKKTCDFCNGTNSINNNDLISITQIIFSIIIFLLCMGCISYWTDKYETNKIIKRKLKRENDILRDREFSKKLTHKNPMFDV